MIHSSWDCGNFAAKSMVILRGNVYTLCCCSRELCKVFLLVQSDTRIICNIFLKCLIISVNEAITGGTQFSCIFKSMFRMAVYALYPEQRLLLLLC